LDASFILKHKQSHIYLSNTRSRFGGITQKFVDYGTVPVLKNLQFHNS